MSRDYDPMLDGPLPTEPLPTPLPETKLRPICPLCGCNTLVLFAPPKESVWNHKRLRYALLGTPEYVDWDRAHLYCCNGETNCNINIPIRGGLTIPVKEARYRFGER
jgi:hypothetical protein